MDFNIIEEKYGTCFLSDYVLCYIDYLNYFKSIGVKGIILNEELIDKNKFLNIIKMYKDFKPRNFFWCIGIIIMLLGIIIGIPVILEFVKYRYIFKIPSAILATGLEILAMIILQCGVILDTIVKQHREDYELNLINYETRERNNQR